MTFNELKAALSAEDGPCEIKIVFDGKVYDVESVGLKNVDLLPDPDTDDLEVHLLARQPDATWQPPPDQTAMLNASANPMDGAGFSIALIVLSVLFICAGLFVVASIVS